MDLNTSNPADYYYDMLKNLNSEIKLELISRLSESLRKKKKEKKTENLSKFFGIWESDQSADEIIKEIRESRHFNREIEDF